MYELILVILICMLFKNSYLLLYSLYVIFLSNSNFCAKVFTNTYV